MSSDPAVNDLDGGYIVEVDFAARLLQPGRPQPAARHAAGRADLHRHAGRGGITQNQLAYIKNLLVSRRAGSVRPQPIDQHQPGSFVDWYLLSELFRNNDAAFFSSVYMWKDTDAAANPPDRLLNMGPIWDFDLSAGNVNYNDNWKTEGCRVTQVAAELRPTGSPVSSTIPISWT